MRRWHLAATALLSAAALAAPACSSSAPAEPLVCPKGLADCNEDADDGCETPTDTVTDCGGCGVACAFPHATASCADGACALASCKAGYHDCDGDPANGCEAESCKPCVPSAEVCDGVDNDCNGQVDDGIPSIACGVGACRVTVAGCVEGEVPACTPGAPGVEVCDGIDNDCNGVADDIAGTACDTGQLGVCAAGTVACKAGAAECVPHKKPSPDLPDGLDNDCNGVVDDGAPCTAGATQPCYTGAPGTQGIGPCHGGTQSCDTGVWGPCAGEVTPTTDVADGVDNDCNGVVDDGAACSPGQTQTCYGGPAGTAGVGACKAGLRGCVGGAWGPCTGEVLPSVEACNGLDDDCNGQVDDGFGTLSCGTGPCANTVPACANGKPQTCTPLPSHPEVCDGVDNDCNGVVDDGVGGVGGPCSTGLLGVCAAGTTTCAAGALHCAQTTASGPESCNGLDDDCNGVADDGIPGLGGPCSTGLLGVCAAGTTTCVGGVPGCHQTTQAGAETCNGLDDNCNGQIDETCVCAPGTSQSCYSGPAGTQGVGQCKSGTKTCNASGTGYGPCTGEVLPATESCKNAVDDDCNGTVNDGCAALSCQNFYTENFNDGNASPLTGSYYKVDWCNSYVASSANTPPCLSPGQTTRTNATDTNSYVGMWVYKGAASCTSVKLSYSWFQFASAGAVVEYKQSSDTFASTTTCNSGGWTTAVSSTSMSALQTCSSTSNISIPFGTSPAVYIRFKSTNISNNAMWWDNISLTLSGCDC